jgi:hypothetical protein
VVVIDAEVLKKMPLELRALRWRTRDPSTSADTTGALLPFEDSIQAFDRYSVAPLYVRCTRHFSA